LGATKPEASSPQTTIAPANTFAPVPSLTSTPIVTPTVSPSATIPPSPTLTLFYNPTATTTPSWSACPGIVIAQTDTTKGDMLHILRCEDNLKYDLGPLAKGTYAVGPNNKFIVYIAFDGRIFAAKIGERQLRFVFDLAAEKIFTIINKKLKPSFSISFVGEEPHYQLVLIERKYDQKRVYDLPVQIME
jgi:hypothetical protein